MPRILKAILIAGALVLGGGLSARADIVTFDFNSLGTGANNTAIATYMDGVMDTALGSGNWISSVSSGAITDKSYNGDGHVTGPNGGGTSLTLGTSDGATNGTTHNPTGSLHGGANDTFLRNQSGTTSFSISFTGFQIYSVSFDFEIFPDGTCANGNASGRCGSNWPDFTFEVSNGSASQVFQYYAVMPGTATANPGTKFSTTSGWTSYTHSPSSGSTGTELAPQLLGTWSGSLPFPATTLTFKDWPATIGIDNLVIKTPEPGSILLLGTALAGLIFLKRKRRSS